MQWASSTTTSPADAASRGSTSSRKPGLLSRSGETSRTSTSPAAIRSCTASHSVTLDELIVSARMPARWAASTWLRMRASSGRDDDRRAGTRGAQQRGRDEVDRRLAPPGALHDERAAVVGDQRLDGHPLVVAQPGVRVSHEGDEGRLGGGPQRVPVDGGAPRTCLGGGLGGRRGGRGGRGHPSIVGRPTRTAVDGPEPPPIRHGSGPPSRRRAAAVPPPSRRRAAAEPPPSRRRAAAEPPPSRPIHRPPARGPKSLLP